MAYDRITNIAKLIEAREALTTETKNQTDPLPTPRNLEAIALRLVELQRRC
jgi:hypothetical protein